MRNDDRGQAAPRCSVEGKFLSAAGERFYVRGVTYGTFAGDGERAFPKRELVEADFGAMASNHINAVRTYTTPPRWLLDLALRLGLRVMVGLPWEQHVAFLTERNRRRLIEGRVRAGVRGCAGHPAVLCYAIGNEIPAGVVRWHGPRAVERFLKRLYDAARDEDPDALLTYANYPTTEYLQLPFLDVVTFNVYLDQTSDFSAYVARLQTLAGDRPLVIGEFGQDSLRQGMRRQGTRLAEQICASFGCAAAGVFVFSWTDEWWRGGADVGDWDFGLTTRQRAPKPALAAVRRAYKSILPRGSSSPPRVSVVVCSRNGASRIGRCLEALTTLSYPGYEVIVVDDGSSDATADIAESYPVRVLRSEHGGLSRARNLGLAAATGDIVAYTDDDARPDREWLTYLAAAFESSSHAGIGGPNVPPPSRGVLEEAIARAPGAPTHVLVSDAEAEHLPGCNMAFRRSALEGIGGFDPRFRVAGDDVDVCWRLRRRGLTLGFSPGALVWHPRRRTPLAYLKQQYAYGEAEALLERKWPAKYNCAGHVVWSGRIYSEIRRGARVLRRPKVGHGTWGTALFQSLYGSAAPPRLPLAAELYALVGWLALLSVHDFVRPPLLFRLPGTSLPTTVVLLAAAVAIVLVIAAAAAAQAALGRGTRRMPPWSLFAPVWLLFVLQPLARTAGRARRGLTPWRRRGLPSPAVPWRRRVVQWSEQWRSPVDRLLEIETRLSQVCMSVVRGGVHDSWDLRARTALLGTAQLRLLVEEHGNGRQLARFVVSPRCSRAAMALPLAGALAGIDLTRDAVGAAIVAAGAVFLAFRLVFDAAEAQGTLLSAVEDVAARTADSGSAAAASTPLSTRAAARAQPVEAPEQPFERTPQTVVG